MHIDLARDWRQWPPVQLDIGPVLHLDDAIGSKVNAMVARRAPRDFIDIAAALDRYDRAELMRLTFTRDLGLRVVDFTDAMREFDQLGLARFADYDFDEQVLDALRERFADWPRNEADDHEGRVVHAAVAEEERRARASTVRTTSATLAGQAYPNVPAAPTVPGTTPPRYRPPESHHRSR